MKSRVRASGYVQFHDVWGDYACNRELSILPVQFLAEPTVRQRAAITQPHLVAYLQEWCFCSSLVGLPFLLLLSFRYGGLHQGECVLKLGYEFARRLSGFAC